MMDWADEVAKAVEIVPEGKGKFHPRSNSRILTDGFFAYVELTRGHWAKICLPDVPLVQGIAWSVMIDRNGVKYARGKGGTIRLHQLIMMPEKGLHVDHKNGNGLDNTRENLRIVTPSQNQMNKARQRNSKHGTGVTFDKRYGKYLAHIKIDGKQKYLGAFDDPDEAASAYVVAAKQNFGEYSYHSRAAEIEKGNA